MDASRTQANEILSTSMVEDLSGIDTVFGVANEYRAAQDNNLEGLIDEVRVSNIARAAGDMLFSSAPAANFEITGIVYPPAGDSVVLTWNSRPGEIYAVKYSTDLTNWVDELDDNATAARDENPDDGDKITITFDLVPPNLQGKQRLFFRVEK